LLDKNQISSYNLSITPKNEDKKMKLGVVGLPNVGKSTLFNALTKAGAQSANYPFCTIEPNVGMVAVPDERLTKLAEMYHTQKITPATIEFVDIAGLVKGASKGEGLGNKFLSHIREVDAIVHVVRCFENSNIIHVEGSINPKRDIETINLELIFADLETLEKKILKAEKLARSGDKNAKHELEILEQIKTHLLSNKPARTLPLDDDDKPILRDCFLLTAKPVIYVCNISPEQIETVSTDKNVLDVQEIATQEKASVLCLSAQIEEELSNLEGEELEEFLKEFHLKELSLPKLIRESYSLLGLMSFLTAGEKEVRAWTIKKGTKAPQAAGVIHTDFEKGFIKAEVIKYADYIALGSEQAVKEAGKMSMEGKDYVVQDGDLMHFKFNV
jgi:GTP-binding protein YchF